MQHHSTQLPAAEAARVEAERILDSMQRSRDAYLLKEMNGKACSGRQASKLAYYDRPVTTPDQ